MCINVRLVARATMKERFDIEGGNGLGAAIQTHHAIYTCAC
jgi:hypothetical protein